MLNKTEGKVSFGGKPVVLLGAMCKLGDVAQDFTVVNQNLEEDKLSNYDGKVKILSVFPSIDTGVCATQNRKFNEEAAKLGDDIVILSISNDLPFAQKRFCGAEGIDNVIMLSDYQQVDFGTKYGFLIGGLRLLARGIVVIDKNNIIRHIEYVSEITDEPDYDTALSIAKK
ncbi:MAG: thiol peroxidase [Bacteroidales bacterium]|nr:thiol peroxidase [Bacteroidales bacterium]